jgi:hypothetical protein
VSNFKFIYIEMHHHLKDLIPAMIQTTRMKKTKKRRTKTKLKKNPKLPRRKLRPKRNKN